MSAEAPSVSDNPTGDADKNPIEIEGTDQVEDEPKEIVNPVLSFILDITTIIRRQNKNTPPSDHIETEEP